MSLVYFICNSYYNSSRIINKILNILLNKFAIELNNLTRSKVDVISKSTII